MEFKHSLRVAVISVAIGGAISTAHADASDYAGTVMPSCSAHTVTVPCNSGTWEMGFEYFYAHATSSDQVFAGDSADYAIPTTTARHFTDYVNKPDKNHGYEFLFTYHLGSGNDITLIYEHLKANNNTSAIAAGGMDISLTNFIDSDSNANFVTNLTPNNLDVTPPINLSHIFVTDPVTANDQAKLDSIDVDLGQYVDFDMDADIHFHGGFEYTRLDYTKQLYWTKLTAAPAPVLNVLHVMSGEGKFSGIGPHVGVSGTYHLGSGFAIVGRTGMAALVGNRTFSGILTVSDASGVSSATDQITFSPPKELTLVPTFKTQIGLAYDVMFSGADIALQIGYRTLDMMEALRFGGPQAHIENYLEYGPYAMIKFID